MSIKSDDAAHREAVRVILFVFLVMALAEVAAPYFKVSVQDPLMIGGFVTTSLGALLAAHARHLRQKDKQTVVLVLKDSNWQEFLTLLKTQSGDIQPIRSITVADNATQAVDAIKLPVKLSLLDRVKALIKRNFG